MASLGFLLNLDDVDVVLSGGVLNFFAVRGNDQAEGRRILLKHREVHGLLSEQNQGCSMDLFRQPRCGTKDFFKLRTDLVSRHAGSVRSKYTRSTDEFLQIPVLESFDGWPRGIKRRHCALET